MKRKKIKCSSPAPVPFEYRSEICASCPLGCEQLFRLDGCPYGFFDEDEITLSRSVQQDFEVWRDKYGFSQHDEP